MSSKIYEKKNIYLREPKTFVDAAALSSKNQCLKSSKKKKKMSKLDKKENQLTLS